LAIFGYIWCKPRLTHICGPISKNLLPLYETDILLVMVI
jgi:hypothetical protein